MSGSLEIQSDSRSRLQLPPPSPPSPKTHTHTHTKPLLSPDDQQGEQPYFCCVSFDFTWSILLTDELCHLTTFVSKVQHNYMKQDQLFHMVLQLPVALAGVSTAVQDILQQEFGRSSLLIPNSIDCDRFRPGPASENPVLKHFTNSKPKVSAS